MTSTSRNPQQTRAQLIEAAFEQIYAHGFQGMRVDEILACTGLKKGAFYHHFPSKADLAYAVIDEVLYAYMEKTWLEPLRQHDNPIDGLRATILSAGENINKDFVQCGCPLNNLAQEMSPLDENFRIRIQRLFKLWIDAIADALGHGQANGTVRSGFDVEEAAIFLVATLEGCISLLKATQNPDTLRSCWFGVDQFLESLRATPNQ